MMVSRWVQRTIRSSLLVLALSTFGQAQPTLASHDSTVAALKRDVEYLASVKLDGRATGSTGSDSAAVFLGRSYQTMQAQAVMKSSVCDSTGACRRGWYQAFRPPHALLQRAGIDTGAVGYNVVAAALGTDSTVRGQWLVIGGHYDHLGRTGFGAMDRGYATQPHLGADDNASGSAAVLELARRIVRSPMRRPVMFVNFGAEEIGIVGSFAFVLDAPILPDSMVAMFNFDMVGRLRGNRLELFGLGSSPDWRRLVDSANAGARFSLDRNDDLGPRGTGSDHDSFFRAGVPVIHFFTGLHRAYHTKDDTADQVNFEGMAKVVDFAEQVIRLVGDGTTVPKRVKRP
jgi:hypothetical protein